MPLISVMVTLIALEGSARVASLLFFGRSEQGQVRLRYFPLLETVDSLSGQRGVDHVSCPESVLPGVVNPPLPHKSDRIRAVVIGASTARGLPGQLLATKLQKLYPQGVEVINLAVPAYIVNQEVVMLGLFGLNLEPDLVISLDGVNDVVTTGKTGKPGLPIPSRILADAVSSPVLYALASIGRHSQLVTLLLKWRERKAEKDFWSCSDLLDATQQQYLQGVRALSIIACGTGAIHLLVLQPYLHLKKNLTKEERNLPLAKRYDYRSRSLAEYISKLGRRLSSLEFSDDILFLDATSAFDGSVETCFVDEVHLTDHGYELLVDQIVARLRERPLPRASAASAARQWPVAPPSGPSVFQVDFGSDMTGCGG